MENHAADMQQRTDNYQNGGTNPKMLYLSIPLSYLVGSQCAVNKCINYFQMKLNLYYPYGNSLHQQSDYYYAMM